MRLWQRAVDVLTVAVVVVVMGGSIWARQGGAPKAGAAKYPQPRFPSYFTAAKTVDDLMPNARKLARNQSGFQGVGLGVIKSGETVGLVLSSDAEDLVIDAIKRALEERQVKVVLLKDYEMIGITRDQALAFRKARRTFTSEQGYMEAANWIETQFADPAKPKAWLKSRRPDLYDTLFPKARELSPQLKQIALKYDNDHVGAALRGYLGMHPEVRGIFWGKGGVPGLRRALHPAEGKLLGLFTADNRWQLLSAVSTFPGDVWQLAEEQTMEPIAYVDKIHVTDPEGTDASADLTEDQAQRWARGVYERGHLYMFPNQATGRFGQTIVNYPAFQGDWIPREPLATINGVLAGTTNHTGFYPRWEVYFKDGYIVDVKGGGVVGDVLREFLHYPKINDLAYPYHNHKGFWYLYEIAIATHPKGFRDPSGLMSGTASSERLRSGVIHWGLGLRLWHEPSAPVTSQQWLDFTAKNDLPRDHGFHTHQYFPTYQVRLRRADKWVALVDKGHLTSFDNPEVRALASRYGKPEDLLTEDWIPEVPGINAPGTYMTDYAPDPWKTVKGVIDKVTAGRYEHFYPPQRATRTSASGNE